MKIILLFTVLLFSLSTFAQSSMRRCTLLPVTDSVGGAIGYKVFEKVEKELKKGDWCTYVSNSSLMSVFGRYRDNLPQYLKTKEVLATVAERLKVGSIILISLKSELNGMEVELKVYGANGEDLYFSETTSLETDEIEQISLTASNWLDMYSKMIPYDAQVIGVLGNQITLDIGKEAPVRGGQKFIVKRLVSKKKHPLLKKVVDWETETIAEGVITNISENQALGSVKVARAEKKIRTGDWVRLDVRKDVVEESMEPDRAKEVETPGTLGVLSVSMFGSRSTVDTTTPTGSPRMSGILWGFDLRAEGWITRQYFAAIELERSLGSLKKTSGSPAKSSINANNGIFKLTGGYKYLPLGFFFGPQINFYTGYVNH